MTLIQTWLMTNTSTQTIYKLTVYLTRLSLDVRHRQEGSLLGAAIETWNVIETENVPWILSENVSVSEKMVDMTWSETWNVLHTNEVQSTTISPLDYITEPECMQI